MPRSPMYEVGMTATDGHLLSIIADLRAEGMSYERIGQELAVRYGLIVSGVTVKTWHDRVADGPAA